MSADPLDELKKLAKEAERALVAWSRHVVDHRAVYGDDPKIWNHDAGVRWEKLREQLANPSAILALIQRVREAEKRQKPSQGRMMHCPECDARLEVGEEALHFVGFLPGERVKCLDATALEGVLTVGKVYTVERYDAVLGEVKVEGVNAIVKDWRFEGTEEKQD